MARNRRATGSNTCRRTQTDIPPPIANPFLGSPQPPPPPPSSLSDRKQEDRRCCSRPSVAGWAAAPLPALRGALLKVKVINHQHIVLRMACRDGTALGRQHVYNIQHACKRYPHSHTHTHTPNHHNHQQTPHDTRPRARRRLAPLAPLGIRRGAKTEAKLSELGIQLPPPGVPKGNFAMAVRSGTLVYLSGHLPTTADGKLMTGKVRVRANARKCICCLCGWVVGQSVGREVGV